jgi:hypothetical protein
LVESTSQTLRYNSRLASLNSFGGGSNGAAQMTEIPHERQLVTRLLREWGGGNTKLLIDDWHEFVKRFLSE